MSDFFTSISNINYTVPDRIILYVVSIILILALCSLFIFWGSLKTFVFNNDIIIIYTVFIINLVNICAICYYYVNHSGSFQGDIGPKGSTGEKGVRGNFITCSTCKTNIYVQPTTYYEPIATLQTFETANELATDQINALTYIQSITDSKNPYYAYMMETFNYFPFSISNYINEHLLMSPGGFKTFGSFNRPSGKPGFFAMGDSATNNSMADQMTAFMISGNIRNPTRYDVISPFLIKKEKDDGSVYNQMYEVLKLVPPEGYIALGDAVQIVGSVLDRSVFACVSEDCVKEVDRRDMDCLFSYACWQESNANIIRITFGNLVDLDLNYSIFSIWRTPLNTIYINTGDDITNNTLGYNIVNGDPAYLNDVGELEEVHRQALIVKLQGITLTREIRYYFIVVFFCVKYVLTVKHNFDISKQDDFSRFSETYAEQLGEQANTAIQNSNNAWDVLATLFSTNLNSYIAVDDAGLESGGIKITNVQRLFIRMLKILFPPNRNFYTIKKDRVIGYMLDDERQKLIKEVDDAVSKYEFLKRKYLADPANQCASPELVANYETSAFQDLGNYFNNNSLDIRNNIMARRLDDYNINRLRKIVSIYNGLNSIIIGNCPGKQL